MVSKPTLPSSVNRISTQLRIRIPPVVQPSSVDDTIYAGSASEYTEQTPREGLLVLLAALLQTPICLDWMGSTPSPSYYHYFPTWMFGTYGRETDRIRKRWVS